MEELGRASQGSYAFSGRSSPFCFVLQHLGETVQPQFVVEEAVNAIGWIHQISGLGSHTLWFTEEVSEAESEEGTGND